MESDPEGWDLTAGGLSVAQGASGPGGAKEEAWVGLFLDWMGLSATPENGRKS